MRDIILAILCSVLLISGCAGTAAPQGQSPQSAPPNASQNMTCTEYCPTLAHAQCAGEWNVSGAYPDCSCAYLCPASPEPGTQDNETNQSAQPPVPEPIVVPINKTINQMMDAGMEKLRSGFYGSNSGMFSEKSYTWARIPGQTAADEITFAYAPADDVKFDGQSIDSLVASGFITFTRSGDDEPQDIYGLAIFRDRQTPLDNYTAGAAYHIRYYAPVIKKELKDCWTTDTEYDTNSKNETLITYFFSCGDMEDR